MLVLLYFSLFLNFHLFHGISTLILSVKLILGISKSELITVDFTIIEALIACGCIHNHVMQVELGILQRLVLAIHLLNLLFKVLKLLGIFSAALLILIHLLVKLFLSLVHLIPHDHLHLFKLVFI
jgi:hypothetical protein